MTDRINSITLVLSKDLRIDDASDLLAACRSLKGVVSVGTNVSDAETYMAIERARNSILSGLFDFLNDWKRS